ncbi:hypothetical protein PanWU01x14_338270, partial [Parasponia andersonii]
LQTIRTIHAISDRTMGITSCNKILADGPRKHTKRKELRNQKLASRPRKQSYCGDHIACRRPEKTYEEERAAQPKTCQKTSKMIVLWGSHRLSMTRENVRRGKSCATKNLPADLENGHTMGIMSLVDDPKKCTKKKELRNQNLPADLENDRTMGITSCNKILTDGLRKRTKREELCNQKLASSPQNDCIMGITSRNKTLVDDPRKRSRRKGLHNPKAC